MRTADWQSTSSSGRHMRSIEATALEGNLPVYLHWLWAFHFRKAWGAIHSIHECTKGRKDHMVRHYVQYFWALSKLSIISVIVLLFGLPTE